MKIQINPKLITLITYPNSGGDVMKIIELSSKENKDGKRKIKVILHEIYKDKSQYNKNGITWLEEYCKKNLDSIKGTSITCEFINDERTEILGHGETGISDGIPIFENATMIGTLDYGYIDNIKIDGEMKRVCIAEGYLDAMRYKNFIDVLENKYLSNEIIFGSVEIIGLKENDNQIKYLEGYKEKGRIPTEFRYSGFAILGIEPADNTSRLIEFNNRKENLFMDDFKKILEQIKNRIDETAECKKKIEKNQKELIDAKQTEKDLLEKLNNLTIENEKLSKELENSKSTISALEKELKDTKSKGLVNELDDALKEFTDDQKEVVKKEIQEFKADPINSSLEIEDIVEKILAEIGKKIFNLKKDYAFEQNSFRYDENDILGEVFETNSKTFSIF